MSSRDTKLKPMNAVNFAVPAAYNTRWNNHPVPNGEPVSQVAKLVSMPIPVKPAANTAFDRGSRRPFKHTVSLPGQSIAMQPPPAVPVATAAATKAALEKSKPSIEEEYFQSTTKSGKFAVKDGVLYQWSGVYWVAQEPESIKRQAAAWLRQFHADRANPITVNNCVAWLICNAPRLPELERDRIIIPLRNAYLEVKTDGTGVQLRKPDPMLGQTFFLNVKLPTTTGPYTTAAVPATSLFRKFLDSSLPDAAEQDYLQELCGYTLTTSTAYQVAIVLKGGGRNGKSVFIRLLQALHNKVASLRLDRLAGFALMPLVGASLAVAEEMPARGIDEQTLKAAITGEGLPIDRKYLAPITYESKAKFIIATNNDLRAKDNSDGLWRRFVIVPFNRQIPEHEVIPNLSGQIIAKELDIFLDWCLEGLMRLTKRGKLPQPTASMKMAKDEAILASDPVAAWISDQEVVVDHSASLIKGDVYENYCRWSRTNHRRLLDSSAFWKAVSARLPEMECYQARSGGQRHYFATLRMGGVISPAENTQCPFDGEGN